MRRLLTLSCVLLLGLPAQALAQQTIVASVRSIDWRSAGVIGGIQTRTTACATLNPGATAAQINSAIASCPSGDVVKLTAGTYNLSSGIVFNAKNNVTLRGAGPDQTFVKFSAGTSCNGLGATVCVKMADSSWSAIPGSQGTTANWTAGYAKGTTQITLSTTANLAPGKLMILDQLDDTSDDGTIYNCQTVGVCTSQGTDIGRSNRGQHQTVIVQAVNGNVVTISPGLYNPNWRSDRSPGAWWSSSSQPISGVGIEDISLDHTAAGTSVFYAIQFMGTVNSWIKNIRSINGNNGHVNFYQSAHNTVRDSYFYGNQGACSQAYSMEPWLSDDQLIENNIFKHEASPMVMSGSAGSVLAYNYALDDWFNCGDTAWMQGSSYHHEQGSNYELWEGNIGINLTADNIHGPSQFVTAFRNRWDGKDQLSSLNKTEQTVAVNIYSFNRFFNLVGNVLGVSGYHNTYENFTTTSGSQSGTNCDTVIYRFGWGGNCANNDNKGDPTLRSTVMRWGNYDTVTATVRWLASEVPSAITYGNPVPPDQTLPTSFYLPGRPGWWPTPWGAPKWPAIGPDVTAGNISGLAGHADKIPAELCYEHLTDDPAYTANTVRLFNANTCYLTSGTPPSAPTNLRISG